MTEYDANTIAGYMQSGDPKPYHENSEAAKLLTDEYVQRSTSFDRILGRMESAWTGDSQQSASTSLSALRESTEVSATNLNDVSMQMETQSENFAETKHDIGPGPGDKPDETFAGQYLPMFSDNDEQIDAWNAEAERVVQRYETYASGTEQNAGVFPASYGELVGGPGGLKFDVSGGSNGPSTGVGDGFNGGNSSGYPGGTSPSGGYNVGSGPNVGPGGPGGPSGTTPSGGYNVGSGPNVGPGSPGYPGGPGSPGYPGGGSTTPSLTPGGSTGSTPGGALPPGAVRLPDGSIRYPDGTIRTPDGRLISPGGTSSSRGGSFGRGAGSGNRSGSGSGAEGMAAAPLMGGAAGAAAGGGAAGAGAGGAGGAAGAGGGGMGAKGAMGGMGAGMGRGGMGGMGGGMMGGRGGQQGEDDEQEHTDDYYIKEELDDGLEVEVDEFGEKVIDDSTGMTVVPPVIGE